jgi:hypothetical protein
MPTAAFNIGQHLEKREQQLEKNSYGNDNKPINNKIWGKSKKL